MGNIRRLLAQAEEFRTARDYGRAIALYSDVIREQPASAEAYLGRGSCWMQTADYAAAAADFTMAIGISPSSCLYALRSLPLYALGEYDAAITDVDTALENEPLFPAEAIAQLYFTRGMAWKALGQTARGVANLARAREFEIACKFDPERRN